MNIRDSEFVMGILIDSGFKKAPSLDEADVIIFNSCSVREHAEDRLFSNIMELKKIKKDRPELIIALMGCTAQRYKDRALEKAPLIDFVCGPGDEASIPGILKDIIANRCTIVAVNNINNKRPELFPGYREGDFKANVSISEGCDNFCSYCIVPHVRGRERSRDPKDIVKEVKDLARRGFKEVTLLGQNVNSYGKVAGHKTQDTNFIRLLEGLNKIPGIERIRFMTSHPKDASAELFKAMRDLENVCEHLHLPMQSGSDRILKLMNRGYTFKKYRKLVEEYKKIVKGGTLTTDFIVGFPTETDKDFDDTRHAVEEMGFDSSFIFKYSPRPPAKSARLKDDIPVKVKEARLRELTDHQTVISESNNKALIGKTCDCLVDGHGKKNKNFLTGRSRGNKIIVFEGDVSLVGRIVKVVIDSVTPYALKGRIER